MPQSEKQCPAPRHRDEAVTAMMPGLGNLLEPGKRVLWVASCGGHLAELKKIADLYSRAGLQEKWATFDTPQSRSILEKADVLYLPRVGTRDAKGTLQALVSAWRILRHDSYDYVVSTGAAVAVPFLPLAAMLGAEAIYIESLTRTHGPSTTGKILERFPQVRTYTQYETWSDPRWRYAGSVLDNWKVRRRPYHKVRQVMVTLGTIQPYRFDRAVDAVARRLPEGCSVVWQLGATTRNDLAGAVHSDLAWADMNRLIQESDVLVCHAGVGSVLQALDNGVVPVLAVRSASLGEHVDDHQGSFAHEMIRRGLGKVLELSEDGTAVFQEAAELEPYIASSASIVDYDEPLSRWPVLLPARGQAAHALPAHSGGRIPSRRRASRSGQAR
jgi:UDP-N-acetylglucosamine transferase subunit ALG13